MLNGANKLIISEIMSDKTKFYYYIAFVVFAGSYLLLHKRFNIRYSFRNACLYYLAASYIACPEKINPFNKIK